MEMSGAAVPVAATDLTRILCLLILALMTASVAYGIVIAIRYSSAIGV